jgi:hypothetical protein
MIKTLPISLVLNLALFINFSLAEISTVTSLDPIAKAIKYAPPGTLVIFDVKEVLVTNHDQIVSHSYKSDLVLTKKRILETYGSKKAADLFSIILMQQQLDVVDPHIFDILSDIKKRDFKVIALTSGYTGKYGRIKSREDFRIHMLKEHGFDFSNSFPNIAPVIFKDIEALDPKSPPLYKSGVVFAARVSKGIVLEEFLEHAYFKPNNIIFVDNKRKNLLSVQEFCNSANIKFSGFEYLAVENRPKRPIDQNRVAMQFKILETNGKWLGDEEAVQVIYSK